MEALSSRPKAVVAPTCQRDVNLEEQVARKVRRFRRGTVDGVVKRVYHQRGERKSNPFHAEDAPTGPILWEREGPVPSLSLSWVSCPLHALRWRELLAHQGMSSL